MSKRPNNAKVRQNSAMLELLSILEPPWPDQKLHIQVPDAKDPGGQLGTFVTVSPDFGDYVARVTIFTDECTTQHSVVESPWNKVVEFLAAKIPVPVGPQHVQYLETCF